MTYQRVIIVVLLALLSISTGKTLKCEIGYIEKDTYCFKDHSSPFVIAQNVLMEDYISYNNRTLTMKVHRTELSFYEGAGSGYDKEPLSNMTVRLKMVDDRRVRAWIQDGSNSFMKPVVLPRNKDLQSGEPLVLTTNVLGKVVLSIPAIQPATKKAGMLPFIFFQAPFMNNSEWFMMIPETGLIRKLEKAHLYNFTDNDGKPLSKQDMSTVSSLLRTTLAPILRDTAQAMSLDGKVQIIEPQTEKSAGGETIDRYQYKPLTLTSYNETNHVVSPPLLSRVKKVVRGWDLNKLPWTNWSASFGSIEPEADALLYFKEHNISAKAIDWEKARDYVKISNGVFVFKREHHDILDKAVHKLEVWIDTGVEKVVATIDNWIHLTDFINKILQKVNIGLGKIVDELAVVFHWSEIKKVHQFLYSHMDKMFSFVRRDIVNNRQKYIDTALKIMNNWDQLIDLKNASDITNRFYQLGDLKNADKIAHSTLQSDIRRSALLAMQNNGSVFDVHDFLGDVESSTGESTDSAKNTTNSQEKAPQTVNIDDIMQNRFKDALVSHLLQSNNTDHISQSIDSSMQESVITVNSTNMTFSQYLHQIVQEVSHLPEFKSFDENSKEEWNSIQADMKSGKISTAKGLMEKLLSSLKISSKFAILIGVKYVILLLDLLLTIYRKILYAPIRIPILSDIFNDRVFKGTNIRLNIMSLITVLSSVPVGLLYKTEEKQVILTDGELVMLQQAQPVDYLNVWQKMGGTNDIRVFTPKEIRNKLSYLIAGSYITSQSIKAVLNLAPLNLVAKHLLMSPFHFVFIFSSFPFHWYVKADVQNEISLGNIRFLTWINYWFQFIVGFYTQTSFKGIPKAILLIGGYLVPSFYLTAAIWTRTNDYDVEDRSDIFIRYIAKFILNLGQIVMLVDNPALIEMAGTTTPIVAAAIDSARLVYSIAVNATYSVL